MGGTACKKEHVLYCFDVLSAKLKGETIPRYEGEDKDEQLLVPFFSPDAVSPYGADATHYTAHSS